MTTTGMTSFLMATLRGRVSGAAGSAAVLWGQASAQSVPSTIDCIHSS